MGRTHVRKVEGLSRAERIAALRSRMEQIEGASPAPSHEVLPVGELDRILPGGGLSRRAVTEVSDCPALVVELIREVSGRGGHVGVVGWPALSLAEVERLEQVIVVPDPGEDPLGVASVLVEGLDLVVWHSQVPLTLSPVRARPLLGRLRTGRAALVLVNLRSQSPAARIDARVTAYRGIGRGTGRIRGYSLEVKETTRRASMTLNVGEAPRLRAVR